MEKQVNSLLVPIDFNEQSLIALKYACIIAQHSNMKIIMLYIYPEQGLFSRIFSDAENENVINEAKKQLHNLAQQHLEQTGLQFTTLVEKGSIHSKIVEISEKMGVKAIVMGTRSHSDNTENKAIIGATTSRVIRSAQCPVVTINNSTFHPHIRRILLPLDLTKETKQKVGIAIQFAKFFNAKIDVVSVLWSKNDKEVIYRLNLQMKQVKKVLDNYDVACETKMLEAGPNEKSSNPTLIKYLNENPDIDLCIIMTQQEIGFIEYFIGSTAQEMIRNSPVPIISLVPRDTGERIIGF